LQASKAIKTRADPIKKLNDVKRCCTSAATPEGLIYYFRTCYAEHLWGWYDPDSLNILNQMYATHCNKYDASIKPAGVNESIREAIEYARKPTVAEQQLTTVLQASKAIKTQADPITKLNDVKRCCTSAATPEGLIYYFRTCYAEHLWGWNDPDSLKELNQIYATHCNKYDASFKPAGVNESIREAIEYARNASRLHKLVEEFENLPKERESGGRFVVDKNIWAINRELAIVNLEELIRLFRRYPKLIDWSGIYHGLFTFGAPLSNDDPRQERVIADSSADKIRLGSHYFSQPRQVFREMCKDNQREKLRDGSINSWFVRSNIFDLHIIRHEFGHVFQFLFQDFLAEKNPKFADSSVYAREFKNFLLDFARFEEWDESVMTMSEYGQKK